MADTTTVNGGGVGCFTLLFLVFLTLKLAGIGVVAGWSWWWVTAPLWIGFAIWFAVLTMALIVAAVIRG